jgi:hypothetical protein
LPTWNGSIKYTQICHKVWTEDRVGAFSSEADAGSHEENAPFKRSYGDHDGPVYAWMGASETAGNTSFALLLIF